MMSPSLSIVKKELDHLNELENFVTTGISITNSIASDIQSCKGYLSEEAPLLEECLLDFIKLERDMKQFEEAANHVKNMISERDENSRSFEIDTALDDAMRELATNNSDVALKQHEAYGKFVSLKQNVNENGDQILGEDEDMIVVRQYEVTRDPITKQEIHDPVKNLYCGHIYSRSSILDYMKTKERVKCPYVGCTNSHPLQEKDMCNA